MEIGTPYFEYVREFNNLGKIKPIHQVSVGNNRRTFVGLRVSGIIGRNFGDKMSTKAYMKL